MKSIICSEYIFSTNNSKQDRNNSNAEENMDQPTKSIGCEQTQKPHDDENNGDSVQHIVSPSLYWCCDNIRWGVNAFCEYCFMINGLSASTTFFHAVPSAPSRSPPYLRRGGLRR